MEELSNFLIGESPFSHIPMELWNRDLLKLIVSQFGRVLKIDEHTLNLSRS